MSTVPEKTSSKLSVEELRAGYGDYEVLHGISIKIEPRTITALIGPSGCGKSTFIRCLNRMHENAHTGWSQGIVRLDGQNIYDPKVDPVLVRRRVGMVFQKPNPFPNMSIGDNVIAGLKLTGNLDRADVASVVEHALRQAALWDEVKDRLSDSATTLSGGQQQRLCIARSLAVAPDVILMDEPCSSLDPIATAKIEDLLRELKTNYTIVMVTHNMQQAARASDKTVFLLAGEIVEVTDTGVLFTSPSDRRTEDYITGKFG